METDLEQSLVLIAQFSERATPLGTAVEHVAASDAAAVAIADVVATSGAEFVCVSRPLADRAAGLVQSLIDAGTRVTVVKSAGEARDQPVGLILAQCAIAETGSVLLDERHLSDRSSSLMTLHSIVIVPSDEILPSLDSAPGLLRQIAGAGSSGYATFVTGPSRTADIEMSLTVGVQGPGQVTVLFVDDLT
jgi:L-lactate dehydrogenase complex protein LldG